MAAPTYATDLTDIDLGQSTTGWSAYGGGGAGLGTGADFAIQSTLAVDKQITSADKGMMHNDATVSLGASDHIWGWIFAATPGILDTLANGGKVMAIGTDTSNFNKYALEGSDTRPEGGNKCYCVRYSTATPSPGSQVGTPGATPTYFGGGLNTTTTAKGANLGLDAFRYGTGGYITAGDGTTPATFAGFATQDEASANKWGNLFRVNGTFQWQGRFVVGQNSSGTPTAAHFDDDSGAVITLTDTPHSQTDFTQLIIDHASTVFNLKDATFIGLGTNNPGKVVINDASASSTGFEGVTWRGFGTLEGHANVDYIGCSLIRTDQITQNGGTFTDCKIENNTNATAMVVDDLSLVTGCTFISDGTGYAVDLGTISTTSSVTWNNSDSGYAATDGTTGNETVLVSVASGQTLTINVSTGASTPTVHNTGLGSVSVIASVDFTLTSVVSGSAFTLDGTFTTATPSGAFNGTGDSVIRMTTSIPSSFAASGDVRLFNGTYYETYAYTGISGNDLTGVTPTLSQDFDGSNVLLEMIAPTTITVDPYTVSVQPNQAFEAMISKVGTPNYIPIQFADNTGSGFSRRVSQIEE